MTQTTLALIDANKLSREGLKALFTDGDFRITADGSSLDALSASLGPDGAPDILLIDRGCMRDLPQDIAMLKSRWPGVRIVLLAGQITMTDLSAAIQGGADGILMKDISLQALAQSLRLVRTGEKVFPTQLAAMLIQGGPVGEANPTVSATRKGLSQREIQIIRHLMRGDSNKSIANELHITEATVKVHLKSLLRKINAANRTQAAIWGLNHGMAEPVQGDGRVA